MSTPLTLLQRLLQRGEQPSAEDAREYSVDELARAVGSSVRNVRAYQDRGLLPPPERRGRVGVYFDSHLKRLRLINQLLERGYSSANIKELLEAWEQGRDLDHVLGLDQAIIGEWNLETPGSIGFDELQAIFGDELNDRVIDKAQALGLLLFDGECMKIPSPRLFQAGLELYRSGIPLEALLDHLGELRSDTEHLAAGIVRLIVTHLVDEPRHRPAARGAGPAGAGQGVPAPAPAGGTRGPGGTGARPQAVGQRNARRACRRDAAQAGKAFLTLLQIFRAAAWICSRSQAPAASRSASPRQICT